jgi:hypothetical protein
MLVCIVLGLAEQIARSLGGTDRDSAPRTFTQAAAGKANTDTRANCRRATESACMSQRLAAAARVIHRRVRRWLGLTGAAFGCAGVRFLQ